MAKCQWDKYLGWPLTIVLWILLLICFFGLSDAKDNTRYSWYGVTIMVAVLYLILECCSPSFRAMVNQQQAADVYEFMERLFRQRPQWEMHVECYHHNTIVEQDTDAQGRTKTHRHTERIVSHRAHEDVRFEYWRDISGPFRLNSEVAMDNVEVPFVQLNLELNLEWAHDGSEDQYIEQRERFKATNRLDVYQDYSESKNLHGMTAYSLVRVSDYQPSCYSSRWYVLWIILTLAEVYKLHVNKYTVAQDFTVHKLLSTRTDLNAPEFKLQYQHQMPGVILQGRKIEFQMKPLGPGYEELPVGQPLAPKGAAETHEVPPKGP